MLQSHLALSHVENRPRGRLIELYRGQRSRPYDQKRHPSAGLSIDMNAVRQVLNTYQINFGRNIFGCLVCIVRTDRQTDILAEGNERPTARSACAIMASTNTQNKI